MARIKIFDTNTQKWVYADRSFGKIPVKGVDYYTEEDKDEFEDFIVDELAKRGQLKPGFAESEKWLKKNGDTSKLYVLPDGYIWAYSNEGGYTNLVPTSTDADGSVFNGTGYQDNSYLNYPDSTIAAKSGFTVTGFIPFTWTDVLRMSGVTWNNSAQSCIDFYDENKKPMGNYLGSGYVNSAKAEYTSEGRSVICLNGKNNQSVTVEDGVTTFNLTFYDHDVENTSGQLSAAGYRVKYVRISAQGSGSDMVVTVNEEIYGNEPTGYAWRNTGRAFIPADYEDRIVELEDETTKLQQQVEDIIVGNTAIANMSKFDPAEYGLPVLKVTGNTAGMTKDNAVTLDYVYGELSGSCTMKWQGSSSIKWEKKNYTIKFNDETTIKEEWGAHKKYCLKANYIDFSHSRNIANAILWGQVVKSRKNVDSRLNALVNGGAIDGFPIGLFINDEYQGIYTFNIPKDGWMFDMTGSRTDEAIVCAGGATDTAAVAFRKADVVLDTDFDMEYAPDDTNTTWVKESLDRLIAACINSDGTDLDTTVAQYLDWDSAIDYIIFTVLQNGFDGLYKNYLLATYGDGKWFFSAYDMDSTHGLHWDGTYFHTVKSAYNNRASIGEFCRLNRAFELVKLYKKDKLKARYAELRADILSEENVITTFTNFMGKIPKAMYDKEVTIWKGIPSTATNNLQQIADFYKRKCAVIDAEMESF